MLIFAFTYCVIPNKQTLYLMTVNAYTTKENTQTGELTKDSIDYIFEKIEMLEKGKGE